MHLHENLAFPRNRALDLLQTKAVRIEADNPPER
jgi:hypothetical protein